ncbi:MAG: glycogen-debranching protein, partial [Prochlorococcus sp.]
NQGSSGSVIWMGLNAYSKAMHFELPEPTSPWHHLLDTSRPSSDEISTSPEPCTPGEIDLESRSMLVLIAKEYALKLKL